MVAETARALSLTYPLMTAVAFEQPRLHTLTQRHTHMQKGEEVEIGKEKKTF